jgi:hypothetical protein
MRPALLHYAPSWGAKPRTHCINFLFDELPTQDTSVLHALTPDTASMNLGGRSRAKLFSSHQSGC